MDKISIIIPVYNVEKFLRQAVESVLKQTYSNLQIILVDDGSTDNSGAICDELEKSDDRILVIHKPNGGLSDARNAGLEKVTGKYVMFLDSDDFYELDAVQVMYKEIEEKNADYVIGNYINADPDGTKWEKVIFDKNIYDNFKLSITDYNKSFFVMNSSVCNKIFRKSFIDRLNLKFVVGLPAEDAIFTTYCFVNTDKVYYSKEIVYNYRQAYNASTISTNCTKKYFDGINIAYKHIYNNFKNTNNLGFYRYFYAKNVSYILCKLIDTDLIDDNEKISIFEELKWFFDLKDILKASFVDERFDEIVNCIKNNEYEKALQKIKETKEYRKTLSKEEKDKMTKPSKEMYNKMAQYDKLFLRGEENV